MTTKAQKAMKEGKLAEYYQRIILQDKIEKLKSQKRTLLSQKEDKSNEINQIEKEIEKLKGKNND